MNPTHQNEGFNARADAKSKQRKAASKSKDEQESDMFADLEGDFKDGDEDEEVAAEGKMKRKEVRFLGEEEIEGQVGSSKSGGHVSADLLLNGHGKGKGKEKDEEVESSSESDIGEEERAEIVEGMDEGAWCWREEITCAEAGRV